jgi:hypothetical protein
MSEIPTSVIFLSSEPEDLGLILDEIEFPNVNFSLWSMPLSLEHTSAIEQYDIIFFHTHADINPDIIDGIHQLHPKAPMVMVHRGQFHDYLEVFSSRPWLKHYLSCQPKLKTKDILCALEKLLGERQFGLEPYFSEACSTFSIDVSHSKKKEDYIQSCLGFLNPYLSSSSKARIGNVLDEMMMNMLWDAPRDKSGKPIYNHLSRHHEILLTDEQKGTIKIAVEGQRIGISASDPFGGITLSKIIQYLYKCFYSEQQIGSEGAGAGLGLYMIYMISENFTINVIPGKKTEFILLLQLRNSLKRNKRQKSFHFYEVLS